MRALTIAAALLVLSGCAKPPQHIEHVRLVELQPRLDAATASAPGIVFGAIWSDGRQIVRAAGKADLRTGRSMAPDTTLAWFSVTKLFTATAILQLAERRLVDLDAPAGRYLPGLQLEKDGRQATVRELLSHTAGVPNPVPITWIHLAEEQGPTIDEMIRLRLGNSPQLDYAPGARAAYSNLGYLLLGRIVENVSRDRYEAYVERNVLKPLGCRASGYAVPADRATGYQSKWSLTGLAALWMLDKKFFAGSIDGLWETRPFTVDGAPYGGLNGPADCLLRFARMVLMKGEGENGRVLSQESVRASLTPARLSDGKPASFGYAWRLGEIDGEPFADHTGGGGGFVSELRIYPRLGYAVAILGNETSFPTADLAKLIVESPRDRDPYHSASR